MKTKRSEPKVAETRSEYDFRGGVRGKYARSYARGSNVIVLDPDVAAVFPDAATVNEVLRALMKVVRRRPTRRRPAGAR